MTSMTTDSKIFVGLKPIRSKAKPKSSEPIGPKCHWDGCDRVGQHRAPVGQEAEGRFFLFCIEHVKAYNAGYNYSSALSSPEVARYQKEAATGARRAMGKTFVQPEEPPLPSTARSGSARVVNARKSAEEREAKKAEQQKRKLRVLEAKAFDVLGLSEDATPDEIRNRYKERLKMLHPDANGGSRTSEEQLRASIEAHKILKLNGFC
jgi:curved DNA-binding protein CbpA